MSGKGNSFRKNTQHDTEGKPSLRKKSERKPRSNAPSNHALGNKLVKIIGLFSLILSVYFLIAFISYLFTWQEDQSYVSAANGGWHTLFKTREEFALAGIEPPVVQNWMGKFGALLAHQFIYKWFGIASFIFVGILFVIGYRLLFKVKLLSIWKTFGYSAFTIIFLSLTLGFIHGFVTNYPHFLEGEFGFWSNRLLAAQIGVPGVGGLLIFTLLTVLIVFFNFDFRFNNKSLGSSVSQSLEKEPTNRSRDQEQYAHESEYRVDPVEFRLNKNRELAEEEVPATNQLKTAASPHNDTEKLQQNLTASPKPKPEEVKDGLDFSIERPEEKLKNELITPPLTVSPIKEEKPSTADELVEKVGQYDPKLDLSSYQYPTLDLLRDYGSGKITVNNHELEANKDKIVDTLANYNIEIAKIKATIGPTVTLYEIIPKPGVRISKIKNLEDDIALSLAALGIRIIAPMPGKGTIGIEVPNSHPEMVSMRSVLATEKFQHTDMDLPIALGRTISNEVYIADLAKMPHLLVAGATGQGKSVGINAILTSLLYKKHPAELKFVLVDPKKVELSLFKKVERHFLAKLPGEEDAIITDTKKVINTLNSLCIEMDARYDLLKNAQVRNLKEYNAKFINRRLNPEEGHRYLPFIVLIVDEFADLMMTAGKEVETPIARLAQLARAVGIHLVIATQRPSVNIITGTIKANFPARLAFRVLSKVDSRTILDSGGADQLIGRGDMLLATGSDLIRIQCAFVDTPEVEEISDFIGGQRGYPSALLLPEYVGEDGEGGIEDFDMRDRDSMFEDAARLVVLHQQGSTSLIQRKLKLGYNRAGRIIDQLEAAGIVGPFEGSKAREVLFPDEYSLEQFLDGLKKDA
ncbi:FtsK/SpoIIIE family DNA translocase [Parapedobacter indicus]|uniref:DNA segregation ATPase FtsK/SpoIIIE, S-DNA-T family n=1 Tax=Parapedobacter indicus TaxID=1477437 RepID=A0A1I3LPR9_9SPHI|nr:DNA translocase FtsK [Parapedobacter indicus]PPL01421.1 S-DNA-T family DNA segregation ATPase FtsK/SpoIIIE [Parapedobacter indicus]SFI86540.1 DNA segregation ATPase FtsK/SpoIIIE, S-DNA-T family [Parapedobacter indicus]